MFLQRLFKRDCSISKCLVIGFLLLWALSGILSAAPVTPDKASSVVSGWRSITARPLDSQIGTEPQTVETFSDGKDRALYHVVYLVPSGFVVVPADDRIEPIICFAAAGRYDPGMDNPLGALVSQDMKSRFAAMDAAADELGKISMNSDMNAHNDVDMAAEHQTPEQNAMQQAQGKWRYLIHSAGTSGSADYGDDGQEIGALCYDAGLSVEMMYTLNSSGAYTLGDEALKNTFGYSNAISGDVSSYSVNTDLNIMINPNLDYGNPVILGIVGGVGGHSVIADGYGYDSSTLYHHINMGWGELYDLFNIWYNLPDVLIFDSVTGCVYNIYTTGTGEIISGRVVGRLGTPISDVLITAEVSGGGTYQTTTNDKGIYALGKAPSASTFTISATKEGCSFDDRIVTTGTSYDGENTASNCWGVDFVNVVTLDGSGTSEDPYLIKSLADFYMLAYNPVLWDDCIRLECDIDLGSQDDYYTAVISPDTNLYIAGFQGTKFSGTFDGNGYKISNMTIDPPDGGYSMDYNYSYLGLFGKTGYGGTIKNVCLENCYVTGEDYSVYVGGLVGYNYKSTISNCCVSGHVDSEDNVSYVGGFAGFSYQGNINGCCSNCSVDVEDNSAYTGGFIGMNRDGTMSNCYARGSVTFSGYPSSYVGGLAGSCKLGDIENCYSTVNIEDFPAEYVGGLCGENDRGTIIGSFWDIETSNVATSEGGAGKTTAEMQDISTFETAGWDFVSDTLSEDMFWKMPKDGGYPILLWQDPFDGGDGSAGNPYQISKGWQLLFLGNHPGYYSKCFIIVADIVLAGQTFTEAIISPDTNPSVQYFQGTAFAGTFDGNGHKISNLTINTGGGGNDYLGLFGQVNSPSVIKNMAIENVSITGGDASQLLGGLVGYNSIGSVISNCYVTGSIEAGADCTYLGGLAGTSNGNINNSYARANVTGGLNCNYVGGLCGRNSPAGPGSIEDCYSTGSVSAGAGSSDVGGLSGDNSGSVEESFWDTETSGQLTSGGGTGKTTIEMQDINTFLTAGWDFINDPSSDDNCWKMPGAGGYPILLWQDPYAGGDGSEGNPYQISNASELVYLGEHPGDYSYCFVLTSDIDLSGYTFTTAVIAPDIGGSDWHFEGIPFSGVFDGNGYKVINLNIYTDESGNSYLGLFGSVDAGGVIKNLGLEEIYIENYFDAYGIGSLAGENNGTIINCQAKNGEIYSEYTMGLGGLVGSNLGNVSNCGADVYVCGCVCNSVGGLVGYNESGNISSCLASGNIYGEDSSWHIGGLAGFSYDGVISDCYARGYVEGVGLSGLLGGLVGEAEFGSVINCYSTGEVSGSFDIGGLIGRNSWGFVAGSFWDVQTSGQTESDGGAGCDTSTMLDMNTFLIAGWDFVADWKMPNAGGYPLLIWQGDSSVAAATVEGRYVFYNNSYFDGGDPAANANDDGAIAPDKTALLVGETATFANYTSYSRGINGIMIDVASLAGTVSAADFTFYVGNNDDPDSWAQAPSPSSISIRSGEGVGGSDRITIIWADNAIQKQWLEVIVLATDETGLAEDDVFYFGNAIGETGDKASDAYVNVLDVSGIRDNPHNIFNPAAIDNNYDINRDHNVNVMDLSLARDNATNVFTALKLISIAGGGN